MKEFNKIRSNALQVGKRFSAPVFFDDGENMFIGEGKYVTQFHLDTLRRWKIPYVLTYGTVMDDEEDCVEELDGELEEVEELDNVEEVEIVEDLAENDVPAEAIVISKEYRGSIQTMNSIFIAIKRNESFENNLVDSVAMTINRIAMDEKSGALSFVLNRGQNSGYAASAVNTAVMSATLAIKLGLPQRDVLLIIKAALLHDIGMLNMDSGILEKKTKLTPEEFESLKMHPVNAERFITGKMMFPREIGAIVVQHHEHFDGSGYPDGRKGSEISLAARILSVCDTFEALVSDKPYRNSLIGYDAVKKLLELSGTSFEPSIVKLFVNAFGVYPVGSLVLLSDSAVARIISSEENALFLPTVQIINSGKTAGELTQKGNIVRLRQERSLYIVRPVDPKELNPFV